MIAGVVNGDWEATVVLAVHGTGGRTHPVGAVVDTGYTNGLMLPADLIAALGLAWLRSGRARLADGRSVDTDVYAATVEWLGTTRVVEVESLGDPDADPLVGVELLKGYELRAEFAPGGAVEVRTLPPDAVGGGP